HLEAMADRLAGLGYADDAAAETTDLLLTLREWQVRARAHVERLSDVWKAIEWWTRATGAKNASTKRSPPTGVTSLRRLRDHPRACPRVRDDPDIPGAPRWGRDRCGKRQEAPCRLGPPTTRTTLRP